MQGTVERGLAVNGLVVVVTMLGRSGLRGLRGAVAVQCSGCVFVAEADRSMALRGAERAQDEKRQYGEHYGQRR
jgi:hypothetical protein